MVCPLARLVTTEQVQLGDVISIDWEGAESELQFTKEAGGVQLPEISLSELSEETTSTSFQGQAPSRFASNDSIPENVAKERAKRSVSESRTVHIYSATKSR